MHDEHRLTLSSARMYIGRREGGWRRGHCGITEAIQMDLVSVFFGKNVGEIEVSGNVADVGED